MLLLTKKDYKNIPILKVQLLKISLVLREMKDGEYDQTIILNNYYYIFII